MEQQQQQQQQQHRAGVKASATSWREKVRKRV
jgi:hypothetical protein